MMKTALRLILIAVLCAQNAVVEVSASNDLQGITIPSRLGYVNSRFEVPSGRPDIIIIQDLHLNRSVQRNISALLALLDRQGILPEQIGVEGATGWQDLKAMQDFSNAPLRRAACDYLVEQGEMPGAYHFLVSRGKGQAFGLEEKEMYEASVNLYRQSDASRSHVLDQVNGFLNYGIAASDQPTSVKLKWIEEQKVLKRLLEARLPRSSELEQQLRMASQASARMDQVLPSEESREWQKSVSAMVNYYVMALERDTTMAQNLLALRQMSKQNVSLIVAGGFHTEGLVRQFREKGLQSVVLTPHASEFTKKDEELYHARLMGRHLTPSEASQGISFYDAYALQPPFPTTIISKLFRAWTSLRANLAIPPLASKAGVSGFVFPVLSFGQEVAGRSSAGLFLQDNLVREWINLAILLASGGLFAVLVWLFITRSGANQAKKDAANVLSWLEQFPPEIRDYVLANATPALQHELFHHRQLVDQYGILPVFNLVRLFENFDIRGVGYLDLYVFPHLKSLYYDLSDPSVLLNRPRLLEGVLWALSKPDDPGTPETGPSPFLTDEVREVFVRLKAKLLSPDELPLNDDVILPSPQLEFRALARQMALVEAQLRTVHERNIKSGKIEVDPEHKRQELRGLERRILEVIDRFPNANEVRALLLGNGNKKSDPFPLLGVNAPGKKPIKDFYVRLQEEIMRLYVRYSHQNSKVHIPVEQGIVFTSDLPGIAIGAMALASEHHVKELMIVGGKGRYNRSDQDTEADYFKKIIDFIWGRHRNTKDPDPVLVTVGISDSIAGHAKAAVKTMMERPEGVPDRIVIYQSPVMQLRAYESLKYELERNGYWVVDSLVTFDKPPKQYKKKVLLLSHSPMFRDFWTPPIGWTFEEWQRRLAWEVNRDTAKLLGARHEGSMNPNFSLEMKSLQESLQVGARVREDDSIPEEDLQRLDGDGYLQTTRNEIQRLATGTPLPKSKVSSAPWTLAAWLPQPFVKFMNRVLFVYRVPQEFMHATMLWLSGVDWDRIEIILAVDHPHVVVKDKKENEVYPTSDLVGVVTHVVIGIALAALFSAVAGVWAVAVGIAFGINAIELLGVAIPYKVRTKDGEEVSSDMKAFIDSLRTKLNDPALFTKPLRIPADMYALWDGWFNPGIRGRISAARRNIIFAAQA